MEMEKEESQMMTKKAKLVTGIDHQIVEHQGEKSLTNTSIHFVLRDISGLFQLFCWYQIDLSSSDGSDVSGFQKLEHLKSFEVSFGSRGNLV